MMFMLLVYLISNDYAVGFTMVVMVAQCACINIRSTPFLRNLLPPYSE
ncbi:Uncharacterized protein BM_BM1229 [Brugia malayi]|uniref:Bm1229 n=1 Tax=Brugia malayi TaxID=6279 RepID=A0A0J9XRN5_BRUMA|nr:Uncharacterized protein BM_BM1229 [Brugia malayi]CDP93644.1 Bm1229 [Brugia malayi]VIO99214.1 Uncharacterized protein BM_BM1229 [Brugia malayi]